MHYHAVLPILGFDEIREFDLEPIDETFFRLKNREADHPAFVLIHPATVRDDYVFDLPEQAAEKLGLQREEDALVLNIMIVGTPLEESFINFLAPLVFNTANGKMGQVVLDSAQYPDYGVAEPLKKYLEKRQKDAS